MDEKLSEVIGKDGSALLFVLLENINSFRKSYGFVASDDVLRAISLMIVNTMREVSRPEEFPRPFGWNRFCACFASIQFGCIK